MVASAVGGLRGQTVCGVSLKSHSIRIHAIHNILPTLHVPYSRESPPMGAASYFLTKQGVGALLIVSAFNLERAPTFVYVHK